MAKPNLIEMLEATSSQDLRSLLSAKEKLDKLNQKKSSLENDLASVEKEISAIKKSFGKAGGPKLSALKPMKTKRKVSAGLKKAGRKGRKSSQPSIQNLIVEILQEKKKPLSVNEIADILLIEKNYQTRSANFKNQLRVLLYRNDKGLFKKTGSGQFGLADAKKETGNITSEKQGSGKKQIKSLKKTAAKKAKSKKTLSKKKTAAKKKKDKK